MWKVNFLTRQLWPEASMSLFDIAKGFLVLTGKMCYSSFGSRINNGYLFQGGITKTEATWLFKVVGTTEVRERCTRQFARIAKKSVKFLSSPEKTVRSIARNVSQSTRTAVVKR